MSSHATRPCDSFRSFLQRSLVLVRAIQLQVSRLQLSFMVMMRRRIEGEERGIDNAHFASVYTSLL